MKKEQLQKTSLILCALLVSCAHGHESVYVVDSANGGFEGESEFVSFDDGTDLLCSSPSDTEELLKACKEQRVIVVTLCSYLKPNFLCTDPSGKQFRLITSDADNYVCLSPTDHRRLLERCK